MRRFIPLLTLSDMFTITTFQCDQYIRQLEKRTVHYQAGCSEEEEALEFSILHKLSTVGD